MTEFTTVVSVLVAGIDAAVLSMGEERKCPRCGTTMGRIQWNTGHQLICPGDAHDGVRYAISPKEGV